MSTGIWKRCLQKCWKSLKKRTGSWGVKGYAFPLKRDKMKKDESKEVYRLRKCTVEPVIGNIKQNLGFREFLLRGLDKVKIEVNLVSIAHNLGKIWRLKGGITA